MQEERIRNHHYYLPDRTLKLLSCRYLFDHAWGRVQQYGGAPAGGMGVGIQEARHWHRRAYGHQVSGAHYLFNPLKFR